MTVNEKYNTWYWDVKEFAPKQTFSEILINFNKINSNTSKEIIVYCKINYALKIIDTEPTRLVGV